MSSSVQQNLDGIGASVRQGRDEMAKLEELRRKESAWAEEERMRQDSRRQLQSLKDRVEPQQKWSDTLLQNILTFRHPDTCHWLLERPSFLDWTSSTCEKPMFWLSGKHGTGKSFLCASAIQHTREVQRNGAVICQFFTKDYPISQIQVLRNLAFQLLECLSIVTPELPAKLKRFSEIPKSDIGSFERLIEATIAELPMTFIFIDGVDEADYHIDMVHMTNLATIQGKDSEIKHLLIFLHRLVHKHSTKTTRLWVSTQWQRSELLWLDKTEASWQFELSQEDTKNDINLYIASELAGLAGNKPDAFRLFLESNALLTISGSFLWASALMYDMQNYAEDTEDLRKVLRQIPTTLERQYTKILNRVIQMGNKSVKKETPTWKIVLSLVVFAKRPMRVFQLREAIAIFRTKKSTNLENDRRLNAEVIVNSCMAFLQTLRDGPDIENAIVRVSHSSARKYLLQGSMSGASPSSKSDGEPLVDSTIIRKCCIQYLLQPKYTRPLMKISSTSFETWNKENVESHHFLSYAAKYWHRHFDTSARAKAFQVRIKLVFSDEGELVVKDETSEDEDIGNQENLHIPPLCPEISDSVMQFLKSPNFVTCVQVQSLLVVGHFIQSFNPITNQVDYAKRTLPDWMNDHDIAHEYMDFTSEWGELLRWGLSEKFNGEVDRCLWRSFGPYHFLFNHESRYPHFQLSSFNPSVPSNEGVCRLQQVSSDGREVLCATIFEVCSRTKAHVEVWDLMTDQAPRMKRSGIYRIPRSVESTEVFTMPCSRLLPLVPSFRCLPPLDLYQVDLESSILRVGYQYFAIPRDSPTTVSTTDLCRIHLDGYWDYVSVQGTLRVVCRRRTQNVPKPPQHGGSDEDDEYDSGLESIAGFDSSDEILSLPGAYSSDNISIASEASLPTYSSDEVGSLRLQSDLESDYGEGNNTGDEDSLEIQSCISSDEESEDASILSGLDLDQVMGLSSSDGGSIRSASSGDSVAEAEAIEQEAERYYPVTFKRPDLLNRIQTRYEGDDTGFYCDCCKENIPKRGYYCAVCDDGDWDMCRRCEKRGNWCWTSEHQLYDVTKSKVVGIISKARFRLRQELNIYNTREGPSPICRIRDKHDRILYDSPPAMHPSRPIVAWALTDRRIILIDVNNYKTWEENIVPKYKLRKSSDMSQSGIFFLWRVPPGGQDRGSLLERPGTIRENEERQGKAPSLSSYSCFQTFLNAIKECQSSFDREYNNANRLRCTATCAPATLRLTWTDKFLYLTVSGSQLRVYRADLEMASKSDVDKALSPGPCQSRPSSPYLTTKRKDSYNPQPIFTAPSETVFLPRSARDRRVQFFPGSLNGGGCSWVVLGPRYGNRPQPGVVIYLTDQDLGKWVNVGEREGDRAQQEHAHQRVAGKFEEFDEEEDCDIIPVMER